MILAILGKDIPEEWKHDKYIRNKYSETVKTILKRNK